MSGGGDGGSSSDEWRPPSLGGDTDNRCAIIEQTILNSPVAAVISSLKVGDILLIALETAPRKRVVALAGGNVAGAITSPRLIDFIECIEAGVEYSAEVKAVSGGRVEIEIRPT